MAKIRKAPETLKPDYRRMARYTDEEKYALFVEGKIRVPSPQRCRKAYTRKEKYKGGIYR